MMTTEKKQKIIALSFIAFFFLVEYYLIAHLLVLQGYLLNIIEILWIICVAFTFKNINWISKVKIWRGLFIALLTGMLGVWIQIYAFQVGIQIPFDFESGETLVLLLVVGPLLEEFLFRLGLWNAFEVLVKKKWLLVLITALLFSYSHYRVINNMPPQIQNFIRYQTLYTFVLGLACGYLRANHGIILAIMAHVLFNFGFWLAR